MRQAMKTVWECVRTASGDNAYERYLAHHARVHRGTPPLSRREFFAQMTEQKWSGISRCC
jgi:uncharacterized short protein YbdD (DUF466 family)